MLVSSKTGGDLKTLALKYNLPPVLGQSCDKKRKKKNRLQKKKNKVDKH